ncbi:LacI family DNA-binding transcriptional regulator [Hymenobacter latericus]|uniref:LacI family DNA-binding transcriptional regulator n=1 Tax=Hymenobacter sp. YIM 151858-1 TaxID=2987688 RepID=UPI002226A8D8|nr:LacI family DNA-binding transcriptional regulator [Hymenobacter sp. YIM 151858-1]UYZ59666.1 LacI family transcriptional regulator [Hymenobacter sp. YIM 151858-1]
MATRRASISDLAKQLNLSVSTISRVLNNHPAISDATKKRVWELAKQLNYQPNHLAAALRKGRSNTLGVVVPHIDGHFFALVLKGIETIANLAGFNVMICQSNENEAHEKKNLATLLNAQVDGILVSVSLTTRDFSHFDEVRRRNIPLVFFDRVVETPEASAVVLDDYQGAYQAVSHLIEQGCTHIAHLGGPQHVNICQNRYRGYQAALQAHGIAYNEALVHFSNLSMQDGHDGMEQLLQQAPQLDAVFAANDLSLVGAMQVLKQHGLRVPNNVALAGFSNELFSSLTEPQLTSVDQRCEEMGRTAVHLLLELMAQNENDEKPTGRQITLQPELLIRESSERVPAA